MTETFHGTRAVRPAPLSAKSVILQRCACGGTPGPTGECAECRRKRERGLQPKLRVNTPGDRYEREADQIADRVMRTEAPTMVPLSVTPLVQRTGGDEAMTAPPEMDVVLARPGRALDGSTRETMERRFGHDFSRVRVHTDARAVMSAEAVQARAYTVGRDVVFGAGQYRPGMAAGRRLLAHELVHTLQQGASGAGPAATALARQPADGAGQGPPALGSSKIPYVLTPPDTICQGDALFCWAAGGATWLRATGINPEATRDGLIIRFGACMDEEGAIAESDIDDIFGELGAEITRFTGTFDYDFVRSELPRNGHLIVLIGGSFTGHTLVVYGVGVDPDGKPSRDYVSVFDPADCKYHNLAMSGMEVVYIGRRTQPGPVAACRRI